MAFWNKKKVENQSTRNTRNIGSGIMHRGRVEALERTWYSINRGFLNSPNNEIRLQLEKTRDLSRLLASLDPYAAKYIELLSTMVVGAQGIQLSPQVTSADGTLDTDTNETIKKAWAEWCQEASYDGRYSFRELEQLGIRTIGRDGEGLFRIVRGKKVNKFGFAIQPIDPNLLDINYNLTLSNGNYIIMGVEYNNVRPVAYHIWNRYASDVTVNANINRVRERVPADEILHIFDDDYGNLVRGLPWMSPAIKTLARLHEYLDAHLLACQVAAAAPLVMTSEGMDGPQYGDVAVTNTVNADGTTSALNQTPNQFIDLNYSQILELPANKKLEALNMQYPQSGFDVAVKTYLQGIAAALQVSYATLTSDSSAESYSTVRHGSIIERDHWAQVQEWYAKRFHNKVYRAWLEEALLSGALDLPANDPTAYYKVIWRPRGFRQIDPLKDMNAYLTGIEQGIYTREQIVAEMGGDWRENIAVIASEMKFAQEAGVPLPEMSNKVSLEQQILDLASTAQTTPTPVKKGRKKVTTTEDKS